MPHAFTGSGFPLLQLGPDCSLTSLTQRCYVSRILAALAYYLLQGCPQTENTAFAARKMYVKTTTKLALLPQCRPLPGFRKPE
jgi:hypothetical protein